MKYLPFIALCLWAFMLQSCGNDDPVDPEPEAVLNSVPELFSENYESEYGSVAPVKTVIGDGSDGLESPRDLAFHPFEDRKNELWVLSPGTQNTGGFTTIFYDAMTDPDNNITLTDGNAWHFLALGTSLAFGENGNWATAQGIIDANRQGGIFTGPSLWSSDFNIYAKVGLNPTPTVNGSHLDMLHQSPMGMGIAHEIDNIYWIFDGYNKSICRYDFADPHYPGGDDHSDGKIWRYTGLGVSMNFDTSIPNHMVLDKNTGWLYVTDPGNKRVIRMDIESGTEKSIPSIALAYNEPVALYQEMTNATIEDVISEGLNAPCGIALVDNRLFVGDYKSGKIICVDKESFELLGEFDTDSFGVAGLEIGPDGKLWYVNAVSDELIRLDPVPVEL